MNVMAAQYTVLLFVAYYYYTSSTLFATYTPYNVGGSKSTYCCQWCSILLGALADGDPKKAGRPEEDEDRMLFFIGWCVLVVPASSTASSHTLTQR